MTSIDDLFKRPSIPGKRKLEVNQKPDDIYKASKFRANDDVKGKEHATVEDDEEAGPEAPPEEEVEPDDDEGRFFGGGISHGTADALDYVEAHDAETSAVSVEVLLKLCRADAAAAREDRWRLAAQASPQL